MVHRKPVKKHVLIDIGALGVQKGFYPKDIVRFVKKYDKESRGGVYKALKDGIREGWLSVFKGKLYKYFGKTDGSASSTSKAKSRGARRQVSRVKKSKRNNKPNKNLGFNHGVYKALKDGIREGWLSVFKGKLYKYFGKTDGSASSTSKAKSRGARRQVSREKKSTRNNKPNKNLGFNHRSIPRSKSRRGSKSKTRDGRQKPRERSHGKCKKSSSRRKESIPRMKRGAVVKRNSASTKRSTTLKRKRNHVLSWKRPSKRGTLRFYSSRTNWRKYRMKSKMEDTT